MTPRAIVAILALLASLPTPAVEDAAPKPGTDPAFEAAMAMASPGEGHKVLAGLVGTFECKVVSFPGPGAAPQESTAKMEARWVLDGRFVLEEFRGVTPDASFQGIGLNGFDNARRQYVSLWMDTTGTGITVFTGDYDAKDRALTFRTTVEDPATGRARPMRTVTRFVSDTVHVWESFETSPDGSEHKTMEITYTRR